MSTLEATALDLVRFADRAGPLDHVATVWSEMAEKIHAIQLVQTAEILAVLPVAQRLCYLLGKMGATTMVTGLFKWGDRQSPKFLLLRPDKPNHAVVRDACWRLIINDTVEPDDL